MHSQQAQQQLMSPTNWMPPPNIPNDLSLRRPSTASNNAMDFSQVYSQDTFQQFDFQGGATRSSNRPQINRASTGLPDNNTVIYNDAAVAWDANNDSRRNSSVYTYAQQLTPNGVFSDINATSTGNTIGLSVNEAGFYNGNAATFPLHNNYLSASNLMNQNHRNHTDTIPRYHSLASPSMQLGHSSTMTPSEDDTFGDMTQSAGSYFRTSNDGFSRMSPTRDTYSAVPLARKKRNKCSPEQYRQLEAFFAKNRNPTGKIREELSRRIRMPERSVQVWFQNKRAKTKTNEIKDGVPLDQRTTISRPKHHLHLQLPFGNGSDTGREVSNEGSHDSQQSTVIQMPCTSLCIGEWRRIRPLICLFSRRNQSFTWYISSESVGFKLECPLSSIVYITFSGPMEPSIHEYNEGIDTPLGQLTVELSRPPQFYMEVFRSSGKSLEEERGTRKASWRQCTDFTEAKQATTNLHHTVAGPYHLLRQAIMQIQELNPNVARVLQVQDQGFLDQQQLQQHQYWTDQHDKLTMGVQQQQQVASIQQQLLLQQPMQNQQSSQSLYAHLPSSFQFESQTNTLMSPQCTSGFLTETADGATSSEPYQSSDPTSSDSLREWPIEENNNGGGGAFHDQFVYPSLGVSNSTLGMTDLQNQSSHLISEEKQQDLHQSALQNMQQFHSWSNELPEGIRNDETFVLEDMTDHKYIPANSNATLQNAMMPSDNVPDELAVP